MALLQRLHQYLLKPLADPAILDLYRTCVAQARSVVFYQTFEIPDTVDGRFDLLLLHIFMVMHRLGEQANAKQQLFDLMFADMDQSLREMGVGDMSVGKKIRPMISAFYGRGQAYEKAWKLGDESLSAVLGKNLYGAQNISLETLKQLADYVRRSLIKLDQLPLEDMLAGRIEFAAPLLH